MKCNNIVFVHGLGLSKSVWNLLKIYENSIKMTIIDLPGHGSNNTYEYEFGKIWYQIESLLTKTEWESTILVLHSMSGALLPEIAASRIEPLSIKIIEGNLVKDDAKWCSQIVELNENEYYLWINIIRKNSHLILRNQLINEIKRDKLIELSEGFTKFDPISVKKIAQETLKRSNEGIILESTKYLHKKITYLRGEKSEGWEEGLKILNRYGVNYQYIPNSSHYPMIDNPYKTLIKILN